MKSNRYVWVVGLVLLGMSRLALSDSMARMPTQVPPSYKAECAACHTAYPPGLLPAVSWQRIMNGLDHHYGVDASLDKDTVLQLSTWLQNNAGKGYKTGQPPPEDRITRSAWFVKEHREVQATVWKLPSVKTAANCAACHTSADQGRFSEHDLVRPIGLTPAQARAWIDD